MPMLSSQGRGFLHRRHYLAPAVGGPAYVQGVAESAAGVSYNTPTGISLALGTVTVGNRIIVLFRHSYAPCAPTVTDSLGNTYTFHGTQLRASGANGYWNVWSAPVTTGGACIVKVDAPCGNMMCGFALEVSGLGASPYDGENDTHNTSASFSTGAVTTTAPNDLILCVYNSAGAVTTTPTDGSTVRLSIPGQAGLILTSRIQATAGSTSGTATGAGADFSAAPVDASIAAFKAA